MKEELEQVEEDRERINKQHTSLKEDHERMKEDQGWTKEDREWAEKTILQAAAAEANYSPTVPLEVFLSSVRPALVRKAAALRELRKRRNERRIVWAGYLLFLILLPLYILEYAVNGFSQPIIMMLKVIGGFILLSFCCLPLVIVFKSHSK